MKDLEKQNFLRISVKKVKYLSNISYKYIAEEVLFMNYRSFLNWLSGNYSFGEEKTMILTDFIAEMEQN